MDVNDELSQELKFTKEELERVKLELFETKEHLKKYTAPSRSKTYYENHKEEIKQNVKDHKIKTNYVYTPTAEQKKKYARTAYLNKKNKKIALKNLENQEV